MPLCSRTSYMRLCCSLGQSPTLEIKRWLYWWTTPSYTSIRRSLRQQEALKQTCYLMQSTLLGSILSNSCFYSSKGSFILMISPRSKNEFLHVIGSSWLKASVENWKHLMRLKLENSGGLASRSGSRLWGMVGFEKVQWSTITELTVTRVIEHHSNVKLNIFKLNLIHS